MPYILYAVTEGVLHIGVSASVFMTISITTERFAAVCSPHTYQVSIYKFSLEVCLYSINVKTADPIGPKFCVGPHVAPWERLGMIKILKI